MHGENYHLLLNYSLKLLSIRPRSRAELTVRLRHLTRKKKIPEKIIGEVTDYLTGRGLIDDEEFVKWWVAQRDDFKPKGNALLACELKGKGIDKDLIDRVLEGMGGRRASETERAVESIRKQIGKYSRMPKKDKYRKVTGFLLRRGFRHETVDDVIDWMEKTSYNTNI